MSLIDKWEELRTLFESVELDVKKNAKGNKSAGVRARRGLRMIKQTANDLVRLSKTNEATETPAE
jgi:hypothetical protein